ncbi:MULTISPECIES: thiaminase II [Staphylococcus]|uniref:Aminopyrimidine aminohydrolase n=1 Tax=Staphylococcus agnetis TaxID=985762 RepID=A0A2T4MF88_9STAP|nr:MULTISPECIES: thiaminase II [Staphylococcus]ALN76978.1 thiaminase II [Staphylococcus agnetis]MDG4944413.1 thiaminase II [Staphylococcus agnetis]NHM91154.1 thiaminase II [Staphylococcus sp. 10602379]NJI02350.1 thiaminase II [Staphylococcus agnetis]NJI12267.1 thiaminase II [Staphylococcus agnetis]
MSFSENLKQEAQPIIDAIYHDGFIQGMLKGDISKNAIQHYLKADARYLFEFAKIYALLIPKVDSKEEIQFLTEQIIFASSGEVDAHHILADYVNLSYNEIIQEGEWYPTADHYIKHMYFNAYHFDDVAYTIAAMAPCPYVYQQIGQRAMREHHFSSNHPLKAWFEFYAKGMDDLMNHIDHWLNHCAENTSNNAQQQLKRNFLESTVHERNFFNMAYTQEHWAFGGETYE